MRECQKTSRDLAAFYLGELGPEDNKRIKLHIDRCGRCQNEFKELKLVMKESESFEDEMAQVMSAVDWGVLSREMAGRIVKEENVRISRGHRILDLFFPVRWKPLYAGLLAGFFIGSLATYFLLRPPESRGTREKGLVLTSDFLEKAELEMARRETLEYLEKSHYLLLDFVQSPSAGTANLWNEETGLKRARELLSKKKFINSQLDKFRMAKAKEICDQIEFLFYELTQMSDHLSAEDLKRLQDLIEEKQLMLKIKIVKKELKKSEV